MRNGLRAAAAAIGAAALGLAYLLHEAQWVRRVDRRLPAPDADAALDGLTVVQLSDFHAGFRPSLNLRATRKAVDLALAARPDLVVVTGDFAGGSAGLDELRRQLLRLQPRLGVFGVLGNHDHGESKAPFVRPTDPAFVAECGVRLLTNEAESVDAGGATVQVAGVDDTDGGHDDLPAVLARLDRRPGTLRLLLSHHASVIRQAAPGRLPHDVRRRHARRPDLPAAARPPHHAQRPAGRVRRGRLRRRRPPALRHPGGGVEHAAVPRLLSARGRGLSRGGRGMRRRLRTPAGAALLVCLVAAVLAPLALAACGSTADPFAGLYWEPSSGRRIEIAQDGDAYKLYYGRDLRAYPATRAGEELVITDPMGGRTILRAGAAEGTLEMTSGGETTTLKPLPQHQ